MAGYTPLFDGLEGKWPVLPVWMLLLSLADREGRVDVIHAAIVSISGCPEKLLREGIEYLEESGRLTRLYSHLDWGWEIPNYRNIVSSGKRLPPNEWRILRTEIFERDDYRCQYCGDRGGRLECDHVIPVSRGGSNAKENLKTACRTCNQSKRAKTLDEWRQ